jgi:hypothetical protein
MADGTLSEESNVRPNDSTVSGEITASVNSPDLSSGLKPRNRAISSIVQAKSVITSFETNDRERNTKNARIMAKFNSEKPFTTGQLKQEGLDWKSNFTTKPLPMLINKVAPRFVQAVQGSRYLTNAKFPDEIPGSGKKTEMFRREITDTIRKRPGWQNFLSELAQENALFGYAPVAWLDGSHWFPKFFRQDEFFVPTNTKQHAAKSQIVVLRERFLIHELFQLIEDKEAAKIAGWKLEATIEALNKAMPEDRRSKNSNWERVYEDMVREANVGISHEAGAKVVEVWHLLAAEIDGKVSHYILTCEDFKQVFGHEDQFESMEDAVAFFSFEQGNGTLHGSKGIGREIYALAAMLDKARNEVVDRLNLSGKLVIQCDEKQIRKFRMSVVGNTVLIGKGYEVRDQQLNGDVEPFLALDQFLTGILDQIAGATTPKVFEGERVTKAQVEFFAAREEETKDNILGRFLNQFADCMTTIQRRICDKDTDDKDAKEMQERLLRFMTREELDQISGQRVAETIKDYTELERQQIVMVAAEAAGNPLYNQRELQRRKVSAQLGDDFADAVLLPDPDPTETAEQTRQQMLELDFITRQSAEIPVSPRDNHLVHLGVLMPALDQSAQAAAQDPASVGVLKAMLLHGQVHLQLAEQTGVPPEQLKPISDVITKLSSSMAELEQIAAQEAEAKAAAEAMPQMPPGAIGPAPAEGLAPGEIPQPTAPAQ